MLTKTHYLAYRQCPKHLWLAIYQPELAAPPTLLQQQALQVGLEVDGLARDYVPATAEPQFQVTLTADDLLVRVDILAHHPAGGYHLIEVKASSRYKPEHLPDVAFQLYVARQAGLEVRQVSIMHLNPACRAPVLDNLFALTDVTAEAEKEQVRLAHDVAEMRRMAAQTAVPAIFVGKQCQKKTAPCPFVATCWPNPKAVTVYDIPHLSKSNEAALRQAGIIALADIPAELELTEKQREYVQLHTEQVVRIDRAAIAAQLRHLAYPLHFFDFEAISPAVPVYGGTAPYQQVPFQYSCHILHADGRLEHRQFLHTTADDPRPALVAQLVQDVGPTGQVVVYSQTFEKERLKELAAVFPEYRAALEGIIGRLWDQLALIRTHYQHYQFNGSNSLKSVLPVLAPHLSYRPLAIQNGGEAQVAWAALLHTAEGEARAKLAQDLLAYCHLDTLAMVAIHHHLVQEATEQ